MSCIVGAIWFCLALKWHLKWHQVSFQELIVPLWGCFFWDSYFWKKNLSNRVLTARLHVGNFALGMWFCFLQNSPPQGMWFCFLQNTPPQGQIFFKNTLYMGKFCFFFKNLNPKHTIFGRHFCFVTLIPRIPSRGALFLNLNPKTPSRGGEQNWIQIGFRFVKRRLLLEGVFGILIYEEKK